MSAFAVSPTVQSQSQRGLHAVVSPFAAAAWQSMSHAAVGLRSWSRSSGAKAVGSRHVQLVFLLGVGGIERGRAWHVLDGSAEGIIGGFCYSFFVEPSQNEFDSACVLAQVRVMD